MTNISGVETLLLLACAWALTAPPPTAARDIEWVPQGGEAKMRGLDATRTRGRSAAEAAWVNVAARKRTWAVLATALWMAMAVMEFHTEARVANAQDTFRWVSSRQGQPHPAGAVLAGTEGGGSPWPTSQLYVCRGAFKGGVHPGKLFNDVCNIGFGGKEHSLAEYEVAVGSGAWGRRGEAGALVGGREADGRPLLVCRVHYKKDASGMMVPPGSYLDMGLHAGKVVNGKCNIGFGGAELDLIGFDYFYPGATPAPPSAPLECPGGKSCSGHGTCNAGKCACQQGWHGPACAAATVCDLLVFDRAEGPDTIYRGVAVGCALAVSSRSGKIETGYPFQISPGAEFRLTPGQAWVCKCSL